LFSSEFPLLVALGTAAIFFATGSQFRRNRCAPNRDDRCLSVAFCRYPLVGNLCGAPCDCLAIKLGEPYGTLILTLSAISHRGGDDIHGNVARRNNPTLGRDAIFAVVMIALNGLVGLSLLLGGLRHREQYYNLLGVNSYLNVIMTLAGARFGLAQFYHFQERTNFSTEQEVFLIVMSLLLYGIFLLIQTVRHRRYFMESEDVVIPTTSAHHPLQVRSTAFHAAMLLLYLVAVIFTGGKVCYPVG